MQKLLLLAQHEGGGGWRGLLCWTDSWHELARLLFYVLPESNPILKFDNDCCTLSYWKLIPYPILQLLLGKYRNTSLVVQEALARWGFLFLFFLWQGENKVQLSTQNSWSEKCRNRQANKLYWTSKDWQYSSKGVSPQLHRQTGPATRPRQQPARGIHWKTKQFNKTVRLPLTLLWRSTCPQRTCGRPEK